jgi:hypothetical protein
MNQSGGGLISAALDVELQPQYESIRRWEYMTLIKEGHGVRPGPGAVTGSASNRE